MPYGSARDLPTFIEMEQQLNDMGLLGFLLPEKDRQLLKDLSAQLDHLSTTVDSFYDLLGSRNWVFHDDPNVNDMATLAATHANDAEAAEGAFIAWYQDDNHLPFMVRRLHAHEGLRARMDLLRLALEDYESERYYAVVQVLLSVMDGFVNDLTPANRKGLHAREARTWTPGIASSATTSASPQRTSRSPSPSRPAATSRCTSCTATASFTGCSPTTTTSLWPRRRGIVCSRWRTGHAPPRFSRTGPRSHQR